METHENHESVENQTVAVKIKTAALVIFSTISIQASLTGIYLNLRSDIKDLSSQQSTQNQLNNMRFQNIESKQAEDHEWMRSLAHRINIIEQQAGIQKAGEQNEDKTINRSNERK